MEMERTKHKTFRQHVAEYVSTMMAIALMIPIFLWFVRLMAGVGHWLGQGNWEVISWCSLTDGRVCFGETRLIGVNKIITWVLQADMLAILPLIWVLLFLCGIVFYLVIDLEATYDEIIN